MSAVSKVTNSTEHEILWRMPLSRVGYYVAQTLRENGTKLKDRDFDTKKALKELNKWQQVGKN